VSREVYERQRTPQDEMGPIKGCILGLALAMVFWTLVALIAILLFT
jgi:hypothetical protein